MKKKICLLLALVCMLVLSGCACEHEWTEADCLNAKVCAKCEETEGEPLGHSFAPATCQAPETCSRCGETQGEALAHTYGKWEIFGDDMTHACEVCGEMETVAVDRGVFLKQQLEGHWDFFAESGSDYTLNSSQLREDIQALSVHIDYENGSWLRNPISGDTEIYPITVEFLEYQLVEGAGYYYFTVDFTDSDSMMTLIYVDVSNQIAMVNGDVVVTLGKNDELADLLTGLWADVKGENITTMELKGDRTFTASIDGQDYSGTWHLRNYRYFQTSRDENAPIYRSGTLDLVYVENDKAVVRSHELSLDEKDTPLEETSLTYNGFNQKLTKEYHRLDKMEAEDLEKLKQANADGDQQILGKWESSTLRTYDYSTSSSDELERTGLDITFAEDGTFTANLDKERAGTWKFNNAYLSGDSVSYVYYLKFDGVSKDIYTTIDYDGQMHLSDSDNNGSKSLYFNQMTAEEKAALAAKKEEAAKLILGEWTSLSVSTYENETSTQTTDTSYTFTFNEDGTFTTNLDIVPVGTWTVGDIDVQTFDNGYTHTSYNYNLKADISGDTYISANISQDNDLSFHVYADGISVNYNCGQHSAEEMAKIAEAPTLIVGTWSGSEFYLWNEETQQEDLLRKESHTITVNEDGTFTSTLPELKEGTWSFQKMSEYGLDYSFYNGTTGKVYRINDEGFLDVWIEENDTYPSMYMTKE